MSCVSSQSRVVDARGMSIGHRIALLEHKACGCASCCRRVAVWQLPQKNITGNEDWVLKMGAEVSFGDACNGSYVEVDVKMGVVLDLPGQYTMVNLFLVENAARFGLGNDEPPPLVFGALSACCGAGASRGEATRTSELFLVTGPATQLVPVPPYAYGVRFIPHDSTAFFVAGNTFNQFGSSETGLVSLVNTEAGNSTRIHPYWPIDAGTQRVGVSVAAGTAAFEVQFLVGV